MQPPVPTSVGQGRRCTACGPPTVPRPSVAGIRQLFPVGLSDGQGAGKGNDRDAAAHRLNADRAGAPRGGTRNLGTENDTPNRPHHRRRGTRSPPDPCEVARNLALQGDAPGRGYLRDHLGREGPPAAHLHRRRDLRHLHGRPARQVKADGSPTSDGGSDSSSEPRPSAWSLATPRLLPRLHADGARHAAGACTSAWCRPRTRRVGPTWGAAGCCCWCSPGPAWSAASSWDGSPAGGSPSGKRTDRAHRPPCSSCRPPCW